MASYRADEGLYDRNITEPSRIASVSMVPSDELEDYSARLLPEALGARSRPDWGLPPHDVARLTQGQALARVVGQPPRAAHSWMIMGARLA